jgi:hypothetical protein
MTIKIDFEFIHPIHGKFRDALNLPDNHGFSDVELEAMKQRRFDNWVAVVEAPPVEPDTVEIDGVTYEKVDLNGQTVLKPIGE